MQDPNANLCTNVENQQRHPCWQALQAGDTETEAETIAAKMNAGPYLLLRETPQVDGARSDQGLRRRVPRDLDGSDLKKRRVDVSMYPPPQADGKDVVQDAQLAGTADTGEAAAELRRREAKLMVFPGDSWLWDEEMMVASSKLQTIALQLCKCQEWTDEMSKTWHELAVMGTARPAMAKLTGLIEQRLENAHSLEALTESWIKLSQEFTLRIRHLNKVAGRVIERREAELQKRMQQSGSLASRRTAACSDMTPTPTTHGLADMDRCAAQPPAAALPGLEPMVHGVHRVAAMDSLYSIQ